MAKIMTVTGPIEASELGNTLMHEHIYVDLTRDVMNRNQLLNDPELAYQELKLYKDAGGHSLVDVTTGGLKGNDHDLLPVPHPIAIRQIAEKTGLNIILGAGWYRETYYDHRLYRMKTDEIAEELVRDITEGFKGTDVKAGIIGEIGAHFTWISPWEERIFRAVARAQKKTGLTVTTHALDWPVGLDQMDLLQEEGVDPRRIIVGHCQSWPYYDYHAEIARRGGFVQFDRLGTSPPYEHGVTMQCIKQLIDDGLTKHLLFSQDVCHRTDYTRYNGCGYAFVLTKLREELQLLGFSDEVFHQITVENPRRALSGED
ncbi:MAG: hypothetical protein CL896_01320 [Dehalococcoidia bacterium]|nr:hypothetical protein [Dehalococcoidia bacterium]|tara:strand:+ start:6552 stop:7496 length:945 start_codon:yes stop_codon:yes gene_type:complete